MNELNEMRVVICCNCGEKFETNSPILRECSYDCYIEHMGKHSAE